MKFLVTGAAGHLGSRLAAHILSLGAEHEVVGVDDISCGYKENVPDGVRLVAGDAGECGALLGDQLGAFDGVFHLAAYAAECMSPFCRRFNYSNNLVATAGLVSDLVDSGFQGRLVIASSIAAYGDAGGASPPFSEAMRPTPRDPYGIAKLACEMDVMAAGAQHGLDWVVLRPHNVYGPYQSVWQRYRNVLGIWMRAALEGRPIVIFGDGEQRRAFSHVDDTVTAMLRAWEWDQAGGHVINVGGREPTSVNELAGVFRSVVGDVEVRREPARHEVKHAWCTTQRSVELLGYADTVPLERGVAEMWAWAQEAWHQYPERREAPETFRVETAVGMPPSWVMTPQAAASP